MSTPMQSESNDRQKKHQAACLLALAGLFVACQPEPNDHQTSKDRVRLPAVPVEPPDSSDAVVELPESRNTSHPSQGQTLYLPVYSRVFVVDEQRPLELSVTVSIRNTANTALTVERLDYVGTNGKLLEKVLETPLLLGALESRDYVIRQDDKRGGTGTNFIVAWTANQPISAPVVQAINIYLGGNHNFAFLTNAVQLATHHLP
jgi:hypothetical protein